MSCMYVLTYHVKYVTLPIMMFVAVRCNVSTNSINKYNALFDGLNLFLPHPTLLLFPSLLKIYHRLYHLFISITNNNYI